MMKKGFISVLRRNKNMPTRLKEPSLHLTIKIRALSRHTSKETKLSRSLPRANFIKPHSRQRYRLQHQAYSVRAGLILCFVLPISIRRFYKGKLTPNPSTLHNKKKSRTIRLPAGNACSHPRLPRNNEAKETL